MQTLEYVCEDYGGRVELAKAYYKGLSNSLRKNFKGSGIISSMQQCNDFFLLGTRQMSMGRVGKTNQTCRWPLSNSGSFEGICLENGQIANSET